MYKDKREFQGIVTAKNVINSKDNEYEITGNNGKIAIFKSDIYLHLNQKIFGIGFVEKINNKILITPTFVCPYNKKIFLDSYVKLLSSQEFPKIGKKIAEKIVQELDYKVFDIFDKQSTIIQSLSFLNETQKNIIINSKYYAKKHPLIDIFFISLGFSEKVKVKILKNIKKIYKNNDTINSILRNPYKLINVYGIGFKRIDDIALNILNFKEDNKNRLFTAFAKVIEEEINNGSSIFLKADIIKKCLDKTNLDVSYFSSYFNLIENLIENKKISTLKIDDEEFIYTEKSIKDEIIIKNFIEDITKIKAKKIKFKPFDENFLMSEDKIEAIDKCLEEQIFIISGGPGRGKTTIIKQLISSYENSSINKILLCTPTGISSKVLSNASGLNAYTLAKLMTKENISKIKEAQVVIIDEAFMVDSNTLARFISIINKENYPRVILLGDPDQVEPVNQGQPVRDILDSYRVKSYKLTTIHRTGENSGIPAASDKILEGKIPKSCNNFKLLYSDSENMILSLTEIINDLKLENISIEDIQIISPMYKGNVGIDSINNFIQNKITKGNKSYTHRGIKIFNEKDRVVYTKNNYNLGIYNGDIGYILSINNENFIVDFKDKIVNIHIKDLDNLDVNWCTSVNKSQGSEFKNVITIFNESSFLLLNRRLLNTAITRAKNNSYIITTEKALRLSLIKTHSNRRTILKNLLSPATLEDQIW